MSIPVLGGKILFVPLYLDLDKLEDILDIIEVVLLTREFFFKILNSLSVFLIKVLKGIDEVHILEGDKRLLKHPEVEHLYLFNGCFSYSVRQSLKHKHDIHVFIHRALPDNRELG